MPNSDSRSLDDLFKYLALVPLIAMLLLLVIAPVAQLVVTSFSRVRFVAGGLSFSSVGLENYRNALQDQIALRALLNTTALAIISVTIETLLAVVLAVSVGYPMCQQ